MKVEINKRSFGAQYSIKDLLGIPMKVMVQEDMVAYILMAMLNRMGRANRDIYDVWFFLTNNWLVNKEVIERVTGVTYKEFLEQCIDGLSAMSNQRILNGLGQLLTPKQKDWVRSKLIEDTIFLLRLAHSNE